MLVMCPEDCTPVPFKFDKNCDAWEDDKCTDEMCDHWAKNGKCKESPQFMNPMCPASCAEFGKEKSAFIMIKQFYTMDMDDVLPQRNCQTWDDPACSDSDCAVRAHMGECEEDPSYMGSMCLEHCFPESFKFTENCQAWEDANCNDQQCLMWAALGQCEKNPEFMLPMCPVYC